MPKKDPSISKSNALQICRDFLTGPWKDVTLEEFQLSKMSGGLSNVLYLCSLPQSLRSTDDDKIPNDVLLRIIANNLWVGKSTDELMESAIQDAVIYALLAEKRLGPKLYGVFSNGRLEEYIPSTILSSDNMRKMSLFTAREMAKIHALQVPIQRNPDTFFEHSESWLKSFEKSIDSCEVELRPSLKQIAASKILWNELEWLSELAHRSDSPVVFCHNDLQGGNILLRNDIRNEKTESRLVFIDFEFAFYNYRGFDIANHFCEWCFDYNTGQEPHFVFDFGKYPNRKEQESFIDAYLDQLEKENAVPKNYSKEEEKSKILKEVEMFAMYSNLYWVIWSFKMSLASGDQFNFNFAVHGEVRLEFYKKFKREFLEKVFDKNM